jgi:leucyl/phenylalanyl-tRNA--protein transferase
MFFGESMFAHAADASKIALAILVRILQTEGVPVIDCQQNTRHLASLGGREIARDMFCAHVASAVSLAPIAWAKYRHARLNALLAPPATPAAN